MSNTTLGQPGSRLEERRGGRRIFPHVSTPPGCAEHLIVREVEIGIFEALREDRLSSLCRPEEGHRLEYRESAEDKAAAVAVDHGLAKCECNCVLQISSTESRPPAVSPPAPTPPHLITSTLPHFHPSTPRRSSSAMRHASRLHRLPPPCAARRPIPRRAASPQPGRLRRATAARRTAG